MAKENITCEKELSKWFIKNHKSLGYDKIIRDNNGRFPDFTMKKNGKEIGVELETLSSNFILHKHNPKKCDEIVCLTNDLEKFSVPIVVAESLKFSPRLRRISFTIDPDTKVILDNLVKEGNYRNRSHAVESAIRDFREREEGRMK